MATETTAAGNESAFLYRLLVSPAFRWMRYLILVMVLGTISFNQVFIIFMDYRDILGGWIYVFTFYIYAHIHWRYLPEPFLVIPEIFVEKALYDLSVSAVCGDGHCAADTDGHRIPCLLPLAAASCAGIVFFGSHADGLHFFFYAVNALHDRRNDDFASERMDD